MMKRMNSNYWRKVRNLKRILEQPPLVGVLLELFY
jgi:hypothetical protein